MKQKFLKIKLVSILLIMCSLVAVAGVKPEVKVLKCEYLTNPIGIDVQKPRLSWQILSAEENVLQTAYEIKVFNASAKGKLLWTSGKVNSSQSVNVPYDGTELKSMQRVYWQVRIWDNKKQASEWSAPAYWETGIPDPDLWKASWISMPSEKDIKESKPCQYFRKEFTPAKKVISQGIYYLSGSLSIVSEWRKSEHRPVYSRMDKL